MSSPSPRVITSLTNDRVKAIRALEMRKERKETGLFVAEGASILVTAREAGFAPTSLVYQADGINSPTPRSLVGWALEAGADVLEVSEGVLSKLSAKDNPQTMLGVFKQRWGSLPKDAGKDDCWLALEEVRDPGNLGTIIRTVDAVGAKGIILIGNSCDPYSREAVRATMGSVFAVPLVRTTREEFLAWRASWRGDVVGTHLDGREDFRRAAYQGPVLLVMGSEGPGLSESLTRSCSRLVKIPMAGKLDSLNLAVATALTLYQIRGGALKM
ncbi:MAG: RNA methyltransferase [Hyphomicrobium sp.]|jgi:TrmH family RNA methyltransferase|uniref:TrmH family RNA methyltransferase n=1 Tax=Hyphomicrobium sp. TaxID=82 RepID=UPI0025C451FC|nr:RNA methyltransferase [Hyphomicrobium sp.]MBX9864437.1 RNA methyltransferase [Hyphomicrobium sp.]